MTLSRAWQAVCLIISLLITSQILTAGTASADTLSTAGGIYQVGTVSGGGSAGIPYATSTSTGFTIGDSDRPDGLIIGRGDSGRAV